MTRSQMMDRLLDLPEDAPLVGTDPAYFSRLEHSGLSGVPEPVSPRVQAFFDRQYNWAEHHRRSPYNPLAITQE